MSFSIKQKKYNGLDSLVIDNDSIRVILTPRYKGRVIEYINKKTGRSHLLADPRFSFAMIHGGLTPVVRIGRRLSHVNEILGGHAVFDWSKATVKREKQRDKIRVSVTVANRELRFEQRYSFEKDSPKISVTYTVTNKSGQILPAQLNFHNVWMFGKGSTENDIITSKTRAGIKQLRYTHPTCLNIPSTGRDCWVAVSNTRNHETATMKRKEGVSIFYLSLSPACYFVEGFSKIRKLRKGQHLSATMEYGVFNAAALSHIGNDIAFGCITDREIYVQPRAVKLLCSFNSLDSRKRSISINGRLFRKNRKRPLMSVTKTVCVSGESLSGSTSSLLFSSKGLPDGEYKIVVTLSCERGNSYRRTLSFKLTKKEIAQVHNDFSLCSHGLKKTARRLKKLLKADPITASSRTIHLLNAWLALSRTAQLKTGNWEDGLKSCWRLNEVKKFLKEALSQKELAEKSPLNNKYKGTLSSAGIALNKIKDFPVQIEGIAELLKFNFISESRGKTKQRLVIGTEDIYPDIHGTNPPPIPKGKKAVISFSNRKGKPKGFIIAKNEKSLIQATELAAEIRRTLRHRNVYLADMHNHTFYSDGEEHPLHMVVAALCSHLDFLAITDHNTAKGARVGIRTLREIGLDYIVIPGQEVERLRSKDHFIHVLILGTNETMDPSLSWKEIFRRAHKKNAIAVLAHPSLNKAKKPYHPMGFPDWREVKLDGFEMNEEIKEYYTRIQEKSVPVTIGSDTHQAIFTGSVMTIVFAPRYTRQGIIKAIREGCSLVYRNGEIYGPKKKVDVFKALVQEKEYLKSLHTANVVKQTGKVLRLFDNLIKWINK